MQRYALSCKISTIICFIWRIRYFKRRSPKKNTMKRYFLGILTTKKMASQIEGLPSYEFIENYSTTKSNEIGSPSISLTL